MESKNELHNYDDNSIRTCEGLEHYRLRPGMYIGMPGNGDDPAEALYILFKEVVDNSIDEYLKGFGKLINITATEKEISVRDFGRGIPLNSLVRCVSSPNTGSKFENESYDKSIGQNGVGLKAVNAVSISFYAEAYRDGKCAYAQFSEGVLQESGMKDTKEKNGTYIKYIPDNKIFIDYSYHLDFLEEMVKNYACLSMGLTLCFNDVPYKSENGILDLLKEKISDDPLYGPIHLAGDDIEMVITHSSEGGENITSFVNSQYTRDGGTHVAAFREAVPKAIREFFKKYYKKDYSPEDIRQGLTAVFNINIQSPVFVSQIKTKLGSANMWSRDIKNEDGTTTTETLTVRSFVNDFVMSRLDNYLHIHKEIIPVLQQRIIAAEKERQDISSIQKKTRERNKRSSVFNKKLRDCKYHLNDRLPASKEEFRKNSSIFITEGDSASGTITKSRDAETQAVFSLRGKSLNSFKASRAKIAENEELTLLINALGLEDGIDDLRYNKIIVATDADDDGMHIRMLILTFFMKYYPDLIRRGHIYILQTPLFRVKNKNEVRYCYSREEKDCVINEMKTKVEITRFKGLGEISWNEFSAFIGEDMRLDKVELSDDEPIQEILDFYMGKNTVERQQFLMQNLRTTKELDNVDF